VDILYNWWNPISCDKSYHSGEGQVEASDPASTHHSTKEANSIPRCASVVETLKDVDHLDITQHIPFVNYINTTFCLSVNKTKRWQILGGFDGQHSRGWELNLVKI
jgi:hypothetical protein